MGYWLEDADERWLGDFATNKGIMDMRRDGPDSLIEFLDMGEADDDLIEKIIADVEKSKILEYIAKMLQGVKAPVFVTDGCGEVEGGVKHLPGQHDQSTHGRGKRRGTLSETLEVVKKGTGYDEKTIRDAMTGDCSANNPARAKVRAKVVGAIYASGTMQKDAVMDVLDGDSFAAKKRLIEKKTIGNKNEAVKELATVPEYDLHVVGKIIVMDHPMLGEAMCDMATRDLTMGANTRSGSYRHELGHAVRSAMGGDSYLSKRVITRAVNKEYGKVEKRIAKNPAGVEKKLSHEWYEKNYGVAGRRSLDHWEENFAEHYRLYHREIYRDRHEGGGGKHLAQYRERHSGMAKIFDAWYTGALLGRELSK